VGLIFVWGSSLVDEKQLLPRVGGAFWAAPHLSQPSRGHRRLILCQDWRQCQLRADKKIGMIPGTGFGLACGSVDRSSVVPDRTKNGLAVKKD
jgi:hypothetical protein